MLMKTLGALGALLMVLWTISPGAGFAQAQTTLSDEEKLEQDFNDPLTTLPQVLVRDSYTPANYGPDLARPQSCVRNYETNQLIIRPLIPRIPPKTLLPFNAVGSADICIGNGTELPRWNADRVR